MKTSRLRSVAVRVALALALGAAIGVGVFLWTGAPGASGPPAASAGPDGARATAPPTPGTADDAAEDDTQEGSTDDAPPTTDQPGANSPGIEAAPEPEESPRPPGAVGEIPEQPDVAVPEGPRTPATVVDGLVDGFPADVIAIPAGSTVLSSSVSSDGDRLQASLEATNRGSVAEVMKQYTERFRELGFTWSTTDATAGATAFSFTRGGHTVVVSARPQAEGSLFTVFGILDQES